MSTKKETRVPALAPRKSTTGSAASAAPSNTKKAQENKS